MNINERSHRRYNPLTGDWVLVSPHRAKRPWQGKQEDIHNQHAVSHDADCYLCAGNLRINGERNPHYKATYVFDNDFAAIMPPENNVSGLANDSLFRSESVSGKCRVICFSPDHSQTLADMSEQQILEVIKTWQAEYQMLGKEAHIMYVQIFENKGEIMGCSNPHPHGQIWATDIIPDEPMKEHKMQRAYYEKYGNTLLADYVNEEIIRQERVLIEDEYFVALVPYWAVWPFETMILPKRAVADITQLSEPEMQSYAHVMSTLCKAYDRIFEVSFPYSSGIHQQPTDGNNHPEWHLHMHFYPPLLRSATIRKFMVGYEMFASPQRDITAEQSAAIIRKALTN